MNDIRIEFSNSNTSNNIIQDVMKVESDVYEPEYRGEYESICRRFHKYKDMLILVYNNQEVIGYLCYLPISNSLYNEIINNSNIQDDNIKPEDVVGIKETSHLYLLSIAIIKRYQGMGIGKQMMQAFFDKIKTEIDSGNRITDITASVVTEQGEKLVIDNGFKLLKDYSETEHYKLYFKSL